ncbi:hypothetical protein BH23GEM7_BH23GEM7_25710 [soil metagenome]
MVDCSQFLDGYSEYRDGLLGDSTREAFLAHLAACQSCSRYDRVVSRGTELFRELPRLECSDDFMPRLQHRIFHLDDELKGFGRHTSGTSAMLTFTIAALFALAAWLPALRSAPAVVRLPAVAARAPQPPVQAPALFRGGPLLAPENSANVAREWNGMSAPPTQNLFFRYSPMGVSTVQTVLNP